MNRWILTLTLVTAACPAPEEAACEAACDTLVSECGFAAFPDSASCLEGCAIETVKGNAVGPFASCVADAACDLHAVVACSRATTEVE